MSSEIQKTALILSAIELARLGEELETSRRELQQLVEKGVAYESAEMKAALFKCQSLTLRWSTLEAAYLEKAKELEQKDSGQFFN